MRPFPRFTAAAVAGRAVFSRGSGAGADDGADDGAEGVAAAGCVESEGRALMMA